MVSFAESIETFAQNLADTKPTAFLGGPAYGPNSNKVYWPNCHRKN